MARSFIKARIREVRKQKKEMQGNKGKGSGESEGLDKGEEKKSSSDAF